MIKHEMGADERHEKGGMAQCETVAKKEVKSHEKRMHKMAGGGLAAGHKAADGIASKGKTKARQVKMSYGGKC